MPLIEQAATTSQARRMDVPLPSFVFIFARFGSSVFV
jgi:hypothetical protein